MLKIFKLIIILTVFTQVSFAAPAKLRLNNPKLLGYWKLVDIVKNKNFNPKKRFYKSAFPKTVKKITFYEGGGTNNPQIRWNSKNIIRIYNKKKKVYGKYEFYRDRYLFITFSNKKEPVKYYYVFKKLADIKVDDVNVEFGGDNKVLGKWFAIDFVDTPSLFNPKKLNWNGKLYLKKLEFYPKTKNKRIVAQYMDRKPQNLNWTKGFILDLKQKTKSKYFIKDGFLFYEWKSGDYTYRGNAKTSYYVLARYDEYKNYAKILAENEKAEKLRKEALPAENLELMGYWKLLNISNTKDNTNCSNRLSEDKLPKELKHITFYKNGGTSIAHLNWAGKYITDIEEGKTIGYEITETQNKKCLVFLNTNRKIAKGTLLNKRLVFKKIAEVKRDNTDLEIIDDPKVKGIWAVADFISEGKKYSKKNLYIRYIKFNADHSVETLYKEKTGEIIYSDFLRWTKGYVINDSGGTTEKYQVSADGKHLFYQWKSGDYKYRGEPAVNYYTFIKIGNADDDIYNAEKIVEKRKKELLNYIEKNSLATHNKK